MNRMDSNDGSFKSRKFLLTIIAIILMTALGAAGIWYPTVPAIMPTYIGGILGVLGLYMTGNVVNKHVISKIAVDLEPSERDK